MHSAELGTLMPHHHHHHRAAPLPAHWSSSSRLTLDQQGYLPDDPRQWSRQDVATWLSITSRTHSLRDVREDRFLMNGKALCLMSPHMFLARVPVGGKLLYKDFQLRLARAMYLEDSEAVS